MSLFIELHETEYRYCLLATGRNSYGDGPERTVAEVTFKGSREEREADFKALRAALELYRADPGPDLFDSIGLVMPKFPEVRK